MPAWHVGRGTAGCAVFSPSGLQTGITLVRFHSVQNTCNNAKAVLSPSERGFHRIICGHVIDAMEGTKAEAAFII